MRRPFGFAAAFSAALPMVLTLGQGSARAALTDSEKAVVRTFVQKGVLDTAPRVRSLVARPDLSTDEVAEPLRAGYSAVAFDAKHERFTEALLFGPGSSASRNMLTPAVVGGLLARAAVRMTEVPIEAGKPVSAREREATEEALRIHAFIDRTIANAGHPQAQGHDTASGIRDDALRASVEQYKSHLTAHERWMSGAERAPQELVRLRAQIGLSLADLASGLIPRREVGAALALGPTRTGFFDRTGVLLMTDGNAPAARVDEAIRFFDAVPRVGDGVALWLVGKTSPAGLTARGRVARAGVTLTEAVKRVEASSLWPADVKPSTPDRVTAALALSAADLAASHAVAAAEVFRERTRLAAGRAERAGVLGYLAPDVVSVPLAPETGAAPAPSPGAVLTSAVRLLLLDAPRAIDLALIRAGSGRPEPLEQLAFALGVVAAGRDAVNVGRTSAEGRVESVKLEKLTSENGAVTGFTLDGHRYLIAGDKDSVFTATLDGKPPKLTALASFQEHAVAGKSWSGAGADFDRIFGEPRGAGFDDGRLVLEGGPGGFDAVASGPDAEDAEVSAKVKVSAVGGGVLLRLAQGESSFTAVGLFLDAAAARAQLLAFDGHAKAFLLAEAVALPPEPKDGHPITVRTEGDRVIAQIGGKVLQGDMPDWIAPSGRAGLSVMAKGRLEVRGFKAAEKAAKAPEKPAKAGAKAPKPAVAKPAR